MLNKSFPLLAVFDAYFRSTRRLHLLFFFLNNEL
jgi:hypothetical protein